MKRFVKVIVTAVITLTPAVFALTACNDGGEGGGTAPVGDNVFREGMTYAELMQVIDEMGNFTFIETAPGDEYNGYTPWQLTEKFDGTTLRVNLEEGYALSITNVNATDCTIPQEIHALKDRCVWIWN